MGISESVEGRRNVIETLCFACEITAILLLVTISWERSQRGGDSHKSGFDEKASSDLSSVRELFQGLLEQCMKSASQPLKKSGADLSGQNPIQSWIQSSAHQLTRTNPENQVDPLTGLRNRTFGERLLQRMVDAEGATLEGSLGFIDLDQLKQFNDKNSMQSGDLVLRAVGQRLESRLAPIAYTIRLAAGRFMIFFPYLSAEDARFALEDIRKEISYGQVVVDQQHFEVTLSASLISLENHSIEELLQKAEEGLFQSKSSGRNRGNYWDGTAWIPLDQVGPSNSAEREPEPSSQGSPAAKTGENLGSEKTPLASAAHPAPIEPAALMPEALMPEALDESASSDDIEALFAQMKNPKTPAKEAPPPKPAPAPTELSPENIDESASSDDIEALFAQMNQPKAPAQEVQSPKPTPAPTQVNSEELDESASSDDIDALFAQMNQPKAPVKEVQSPKPTPAPTQVNSEELDESASSDDIEALFAQVKSVSDSVAAEARPLSETERAAAAEKKEISELIEQLDKIAPKPQPSIVVDATESASADDIEALFAAMKGQ